MRKGRVSVAQNKISLRVLALRAAWCLQASWLARHQPSLLSTSMLLPWGDPCSHFWFSSQLLITKHIFTVFESRFSGGWKTILPSWDPESKRFPGKNCDASVAHTAAEIAAVSPRHQPHSTSECLPPGVSSSLLHQHIVCIQPPNAAHAEGGGDQGQGKGALPTSLHQALWGLPGNLIYPVALLLPWGGELSMYSGCWVFVPHFVRTMAYNRINHASNTTYSTWNIQRIRIKFAIHCLMSLNKLLDELNKLNHQGL